MFKRAKTESRFVNILRVVGATVGGLLILYGAPIMLYAMGWELGDWQSALACAGGLALAGALIVKEVAE